MATDVGLEKDDRIACAIAIAAATSDAAVRRQLWRDNTALLRFAREIAAWQHNQDADFRLDRYSLETQIAWASRCLWLGVKYLQLAPDAGRAQRHGELPLDAYQH